AVRHLELGSGRFLPAASAQAERPVAVIGAKARDELFAGTPPLGRWIRIGDRRFRVIGVLASEGRSLGLDLDEIVVIPVASALALFNSSSLFRIMVEADSREAIPAAEQAIKEILRRRHEGEEDVTVIRQDAVLGTFDRILGTLTLAVGGIAAISLLVAGVLVMNVMLVSVTERTAEIGLLKALGAPPRQILGLFLAEAGLLSLAGGLAGLVVGEAGAWGIGRLYPSLPVEPPPWAIGAGLGTALVCGVACGLLPARRAARLDPVTALGRR
ncbi:MAG TPA: ABC transporter permease, partial [Candidatus Polarisedimenticolaceae bacterium]|nr:ABC transporter permease [Candidatus Polarisedimenticolaceae bacterium]